MAEPTARKSWLKNARRLWQAPDDGRVGMKVSELVEKLTAAGYRNREGDPITEGTVRGWEAPATGDVPDRAIPYLERILRSKAPGEGQPADQAALITALTQLTAELAERNQLDRDLITALSGRVETLEQRVGRVEEAEPVLIAHLSERLGVLERRTLGAGPTDSPSEGNGSAAAGRQARP